MPTAMVRSAAASRTTPCTMTPAQPFWAASPAMMSPTNAVCIDPPPSTTSTPPSPGVDRIDFSRALSWKQRTVVMRPAKAGTAP